MHIKHKRKLSGLNDFNLLVTFPLKMNLFEKEKTNKTNQTKLCVDDRGKYIYANTKKNFVLIKFDFVI